MTDAVMQTLFLMLAAHALCDGPLQSGGVSAGKRSPDWRVRGQSLAVHGLIHGGAVALITGWWCLGVAEAGAHVWIDDAKARGRFGLVTDQLLHALCKVLWVAVLVWRGGWL